MFDETKKLFEKNLKLSRIEKSSIAYSSDETIDDNFFIYTEQNSLEPQLCEEIITRFEKSNEKSRGITGKNNVDLSIKNTFDLQLSNKEEWKDIDKILFEKLNGAIINYYNRLAKVNIEFLNMIKYNILYDSGFHIQKYEKNKGFYVWHNDTLSEESSTRLLTFIWYLNDIEEGGETAFLNNKIAPETGTLLIFPSTWPYLNKGCIPVTDDKYIITGWLSSVM